MMLRFGDDTGSGGGLGTFRRLPKAPIFIVRHLEGGLQGPKLTKMAKKDNFAEKI